MSDTQFDVVVVGAGPAGSAAAFALASSGSRTLVLERRARVDFKFGELLPPHASPLIKRFGIDPSELIKAHAPARGVVSVWGDAQHREQDFLFNPYGDGVRLDRPTFDDSLRALAAEAGATVLTGARVVDIDPAEAGPGGRTYVNYEIDGVPGDASARYVLDCSGRSSVIARMLGSERLEPDHLFAFARRFVPANGSVDRDPFLRIEAVPDGWLYTLRIPSGERMVVFHTDHDLDGDLDTALAASSMIGPLLRECGYEVTGRLRTSAAGSAWRSPLLAPGVLAAGDATLAFDPLASRGMFSALTTGFAAADAIAATVDGDDDAIDGYVSLVEQDAIEYRAGYGEMYAYERRFADRPFWTRRHHDECSNWTQPLAG